MMLRSRVSLSRVLTGLLVVFGASGLVAASKSGEHWVDVWASMPQEVEPHNLPPAPYTAAEGVFINTTVRQTVRLTQDVSIFRLHFSNAFGGADLPITAVTVALPANGTSGSPAVSPETLKEVRFSGQAGYVVPNGALVVSDPIRLSVRAGFSITVTTYLAAGQASQRITGHPGSRTASYFAPGNQVSTTDVSSLAGAARVDRWFLLSAVEAYLPKHHAALAIIGDSITDGRGSTTNGNDRWPDQLHARLLSSREDSLRSLSVINQAAGGNRVLADGLGPNALGRLERDVIAHAGVRCAIIFEGVNDLGTGASDAASQTVVGGRLLLAYDQMVTRLHRAGIAVLGATITPMSGPGQAYGEGARDEQRQRVNQWIRTSGRFDGVIDFDRAVRGVEDPSKLRPEYDTGDYLHLNPVGYKAMAETVDLKMLARCREGYEGLT